jgi:hydroxypyruvate isomerase
MLFSDMPTADAMRLAKEAGADGAELWSTDGKDLTAIARASRELDLPIAVFCAPNKPALISPAGAQDYPEILRWASAACDVLGCRKLIALSGVPDWTWTPSEMHDRLIAAVEATVPVLEACDLTLLLEPLNASEMSYLRSSREAFDICRMTGSPRVKVLFDVYHMQYMEGNLINTIRANLPFIGHFHVADLPDRTAPGAGEINYPNVLRAADQAGYEGYFGLEYQPGSDRLAELALVTHMLR